jgi:predicted nucleic acid-binding protein
MADPRFVDANVLVLFFTGATSPIPLNRQKAALAKALLQRVEQGLETVVTSLTVLYETVFVLQRSFRIPKVDIRDALLDLLSLSGVMLPNKRLFVHALDLYVSSGLSIVDSYVAVEMQSRGLKELYSWDTGFDQVPGIMRIEPS